MTALYEIAEKKAMSFDDLSKHICAIGGPIFVGTKAEKVKWHDDKSSYTGVYANGGPTSVDKGKTVISDIQ